jgi:S-DNA-T family DNA segregation ATPase FtsK/SpoIIIE
MGKKKTVEKEPEGEEEGFRFADILHSDAKRSIAAVLLFAFSLIVILGYFDAAGKLGSWLDHGMGILFGYGKWPFPLLLMVAGVMFLTRRKTTLADAVKYVGLLVAFLAILGFTHLLSGDTAADLLRVANAGAGGGLIGYGFAALLLELTSRLAGGVILFMLFLIGVIAAFNVSLMHWFELLRARFTLPQREIEEAAGTETGEAGGELVAPVEMTQIPEDGLDPDEPARAFEEQRKSEEAQPLVPVALALPEESLTDGNIESLRFHEDTKRQVPLTDETAALEELEDLAEDEGLDGVGDEGVREAVVKKRRRRTRSNWVKPSTELLESKSGEAVGGDTDRSKHIIMSTLKHFGIEVEAGEITVGPTVTRYTFRPGAGVKLSRITGLSNNLALALAAESVRIEAPVPGQAYIGIEIPNKSKAMVRMREIIENREFRDARLPLLLAIGQDVTGKSVFADLGEMPHLLIAGRTKSGKSVCVNAILTSLLYNNTPDEVKLILVDPKRVELSMYKGIPHLKTDVVVDGKKVVNALSWATNEMERRYKLLEAVHVRDLPAYQALCRDGYQKVDVDERTGAVREVDLEPLPFIVIVIDELAEIMVGYGKEVEPKIVRLAQMSRAVGIHLILATQRPSVEVITGLIKTNLPTRIAFQVSSQVDSRTILDTGGAEKLLGNGDMLYVSPSGETKRLQGVYVSTDEVRRVTNHWRKEKEAWGDEDSLEDDITAGTSATGEGSSGGDGEKDELFDQARDLFIRSQKASTTSLQTAFGIGYPRAARLMHILEQEGVVGMMDGKKQILIGRDMVSAPGPSESPQYGDDTLRDQAERDKWQA